MYSSSWHGRMVADDEMPWVAVTFMHEGTSSLSNIFRNQPSLRGWSIKYCWALEFWFIMQSQYPASSLDHFERRLKHLAARIGRGPCRYLQAQVAQVAGTVQAEDRASDLNGHMKKLQGT